MTIDQEIGKITFATNNKKKADRSKLNYEIRAWFQDARKTFPRGNYFYFRYFLSKLYSGARLLTVVSIEKKNIALIKFDMYRFLIFRKSLLFTLLS